MIYSVEAERAVLGGIMAFQGAYSRIRGKLTAEDFYTSSHQQIFSAVLALDAESKPLDLVTIGEWLEAKDRLEDAGSLSYLTEIFDNCPSAANIEAYAQIVHGRAVKRALVAVCAGIIERAKNTDSDELMTDLQAGMDRITRQGGSEYRNFTDVLMAADEAISIAMKAAETGEAVGVPTGLPALDRRIGGLPNGRLIILAARPSLGKSALAQQIAIHAARHDLPAGICSLEMTADEIGIRSYAHCLSINGTGLTFGDADIVARWEQIEKTPMMRYPIYVDTDTYSLPSIIGRAHEWKTRHGIRLFIVDYLQLIEECKGDTRALQVADATRSLKKLAKRLDIPVLLLSQLNRDNEKHKRRPQLSDLRDSGAIEQDCDVALFLHTDDEDAEDTINIEIGALKTRYGKRGWLRQPFMFDGRAQKFMEREWREFAA